MTTPSEEADKQEDVAAIYLNAVDKAAKVLRPNPDTQSEKPDTMMGQLIAEIAKFGGFDKTKASQLARILLPHITAHSDRLIQEAVDKAVVIARLDEFKQTINAMNTKTELHPISNETRLKWRTRQRELQAQLTPTTKGDKQ